MFPQQNKRQNAKLRNIKLYITRITSETVQNSKCFKCFEKVSHQLDREPQGLSWLHAYRSLKKTKFQSACVFICRAIMLFVTTSTEQDMPALYISTNNETSETWVFRCFSWSPIQNRDSTSKS